MVNNSISQRSKSNGKMSISVYLSSKEVSESINRVVAGKDGQRFIASIVSAVTLNPELQKCTNQSILSAALLGESLKLSPSPQLGQYYFVPYEKRRGSGVFLAQFQIGYKGYIQLAIRSGYYKKLNVLAIKEGELVRFDPLNEEIEINLIPDEEERENAKTVGYYAMFEYLNGFRKCMYWSVEKMRAHAIKYSKGYAADLKNKTAFTFWSKDFDGMAYKTMIRQLISKWGIMSVDMATAYQSDMAVIGQDGTPTYVDNDDTAEDFAEPEKPAEPVEEAAPYAPFEDEPEDNPFDPESPDSIYQQEDLIKQALRG